jgi:hypothetical protein
MDLFMPGVWRIEIRIETEQDVDWIEFNFDLEG